VARQFGFDQDISGSNLEVLGPDYRMDPYLKGKAYAFYSSMMPQVLYPGPSRVGACTKRMHDYWARVMGIFVKYVNGGTPSDIPMPSLRIKPPSDFRILRNVASGNGYGSRQGAGYVEWHEEKSSWKVFGTHLPPEWSSTHFTFIEEEGGRFKKGKRIAEESPVAPIDPSKEGKKKARVHMAPATPFPITSIDVLATSEPVSPSTIVTKGSARRTHSQSKLIIAPVVSNSSASFAFYFFGSVT
jgi:hypothetical protein